MQSLSAPTQPVNQRSAAQQVQDGFDAYCAGKLLKEMTTPSMVVGWWRGNKAQASAEMPPMAERFMDPTVTWHGDIYQDEPAIEDDHQWIQQGC